jgi:hypothetical protein
MSGEDLDSFFAEINQIVAEEAPAKPTVEADIGPQVSIISQPQIISKPAVSNRTVVAVESAAVASHPVYTYAQPEFFNNANFNTGYEQPEVQFYQNAPVHDTRPPPPATVAPPQVPRQDKVRSSTNDGWLLLLCTNPT